MEVADLINLIVALCRYLEVPPEKLTEFFKHMDENQKYWDLVVQEYKKGK